MAPAARPVRSTANLDELARLRLAVHQLEHALAARVVVEQAIGVLSERAGTSAREAFEQLRRVARSHGRKVHDLSREVVASVTDPSVTLPGGLPVRR
jgi:AmiR/NasT family two-component response regulator